MDFEAGATTTTTTRTMTETHVQTTIQWDPGYMRTIPGMLKVAQVVLSLIGFICALCTGAVWRESSTAEWYCFVSMTAFWTSSALLIFYILHVIEKFHVIPWLLIEMVFCAIWSFLFFTTACDTAAHAQYVSAFGAASFFAFVLTIIYGYDAFIKFTGWRANQLAQGERTVIETTTQVASPAY